MKTYTLEYDSYELARVQIDPATADQPIKEMVEFWACWEWRLKRCGGDYTKTFLTMLAKRILNHGDVPKDEEGWYPLDGSNGVKVLSVTPYEYDHDLIEITEE